jgi:predicted RNA polymerase sigma factor
MAFGPEAGLELVDELVSWPSLKAYHLLPSVRGDLLAKLDRNEEARADFERAAALTHNARARTAAQARRGVRSEMTPRGSGLMNISARHSGKP